MKKKISNKMIIFLTKNDLFNKYILKQNLMIFPQIIITFQLILNLKKRKLKKFIKKKMKIIITQLYNSRIIIHMKIKLKIKTP